MKSTQDSLLSNLKDNSAAIKEGVLALDKGLQTVTGNPMAFLFSL
jgi:hypothetical protein